MFGTHDTMEKVDVDIFTELFYAPNQSHQIRWLQDQAINTNRERGLDIRQQEMCES